MTDHRQAFTSSQMANSTSVSILQTPSAAVADFIARAEGERLDLHSVLLLHHGTIVAEAYRAPFDAKTPHRVHSVTKSFTSTAVGLAVADGLLSVDQKVVDIFPDLVPHPIGKHLAELRVKHLLTMSAEHPLFPGQPHSRATPSVAAYLAEELALPPGSRFEYSTPCSYMLAAIVERATGELLADYLRPRLFDPLNIAARHWVRSEEGVTNGGWGLHLTPREMARFGQLLLQRGIWEGRRLVPEAWIDEATALQVASWGNAGASDWTAGYAYQFWRNRTDGFRADGLLGQFCFVLPGFDAVLVTTAGTLATQRILDLVWEKVLPALTHAAETTPSTEPPSFLSARVGESRSPRAGELNDIAFVIGEPFVLPTRIFGGQASIVAVKAELPGKAIALHLADRNGSYRLPIGMNEWAGGLSPVSTGYPEPYMGFARWESPGTLVAELVFTEGGFRLTLTFDLDKALLAVKTPANPGLDGRTILARRFP